MSSLRRCRGESSILPRAALRALAVGKGPQPAAFFQPRVPFGPPIGPHGCAFRVTMQGAVSVSCRGRSWVPWPRPPFLAPRFHHTWRFATLLTKKDT
jgi:hypothetical protein